MTLIIAHRGASQLAPENTLPAFQQAYKEGAQMIELDVHLTKDFVPIVMHDEDILRTTNGKGLIQNLNYSEIQKLDAGSWFHASFAGTYVVSLEDVIDWAISYQMDLNIELKTNKIKYPDIEKIVYECVLKKNFLSRVVFSSFSQNSIYQLRMLDDNIQLALLTKRMNKRSEILKIKEKLQLDAFHCDYRNLKKSIYYFMKKQGLAVRVYTLNDVKEMKIWLDLNVDGIITDAPGKLCHLINE